jgi:glycosyltransferase involved in cell wall biosynthesis
MRICLIAPVPPFRGGIAKYCHSLARELERRHDLLLLSYTRQYPGFLYGRKPQIDPDCSAEQVMKEFGQLRYAIDSASLLSWIATVRTIAAFGPDLVILPWWVAYWAPMYLYLLHALGRRGIRVLVLCINVFEHENSRLKQFLTTLFLRRAGAMIAHSVEEEAELRAMNPHAVIRSHPLPLFDYPAQPSPHGGTTYRLLFFGFVRPYKGLDTLLHALSRLKQYDISLCIAGEFWGGTEPYLRLINELDIADRVEIADRYIPDADMGRYFARADLVVLPYRRSKTSGIIATAYGFGKPVLATDVGGFHDAVLDGATGRLVPPDDPAALAEGILWFVRNRSRDYRNEIATFTANRMSWRSLVDVVEQVVLQVR